MAGSEIFSFEVFANRHKNNKHENHCRCSICGKLASTVSLGCEWVCAGCLERGRLAINREILRKAGHGSQETSAL